MSRDEFHAFCEYVGRLWPDCVLNPEQVHAWHGIVGHVELERAKRAIEAAYAESVWKEPLPGKVSEHLQRLPREAVAARPELPAADVYRLIDADQQKRREHVARMKQRVGTPAVLDGKNKKLLTRVQEWAARA